jgi:hypothetical protein
MNNNQQFDDHIKEQLGNATPDVPSHIWDAIVAKRKRKPVGLLFYLFNARNVLIIAGVLLAGACGAWLIGNDIFGTSKKNEIIAKNSSNKNNGGINDNTATPGNNTIDTTNSNDNTNISTPANSNTAVTAAAADNIYRKESVAGKLKIEVVPTDIINANNVLLNTEPKVKKTNSTTVDENEDADIASTGLPFGGTLRNQLQYDIEKRSKKTNADVLNKITNPNLSIPGCPVEKNVSGNKKYVEVYGSYDYGLRSLKDSGTNSAYLQQRKQSTTFTSAYSFGLRYTRVFNNSMSVRTGVNYSQINEKLTLVQGNVVQVIYIINAAGDTTGSYTTTGTRYKTTHNKYRTIDIPLLVGYEMGNGRLHTNINIGPVINIYSWQKGEVLDANGQPVSITTGKSNSPYGFKTNAGIGFMGAVSVYYKLTDRLHLLAEPYFRYNLSPMNKEGITFKQKYNTVGFKLGVRLDIP